MSKYEIGYEKFLKFIHETDLIPKNKTKIIIAYSGGKDASVMCDFLCEYKKKERPDLSLEMITAGFPTFLYEPSNPTTFKLFVEALSYWEKRGITHTHIKAKEEQRNIRLTDYPNPCRYCSKAKTIILADYVRKKQNHNSIFAIGMNLDDSIGWFLEIQLIAANLGTAQNIKENYPDLYHEIAMIATRTIHKVYDSAHDILFTRPLIDFNNQEITEICKERGLPLVPENCREITKKDTFYDSPRRDIAQALSCIRLRYNTQDTIYNKYLDAFHYYQKCEFFPTQKELEDIMSKNLLI